MTKKTKVEIDDVVTLIAETASANAERGGETSIEDIEEILVGERVGPEDFPAVAEAFIDCAGTSEGWTLDEVRVVLGALKRTPAEMSRLGARLLDPSSRGPMMTDEQLAKGIDATPE